MPKRSNQFQNLIYQLHKQFSDNATITESKLLKDPQTGSYVEIDIFIEAEMSGIPFTVGIECTSRSRPADLVWYRGLIQKHKELGISKTVLVSESGFTDDVITKAKLVGVETLSINEAIDRHWSSWIGKIKSMVNIGFRPVDFALSIDPHSMITPEFLHISHESMISVNGTALNVKDYITGLAASSGATRKILKNYKRIPTNCRSIEVSLQDPNDTHVYLLNGTTASFSKVDVTLEFEFDDSEINLNSASYNKKDIAYTTIKSPSGPKNSEALLTFVKKANNDVESRLTYVDENKKEVDLKMNILAKYGD